jgi:hypothetical protein
MITITEATAIRVFARTADEVAQRAQAIRNATPNFDAENLYEMSNRICDLCEHPIWNLIEVTIDHSTPVIHFARGPLSIEEAIAACHHPQNIRVAHESCNKSKNSLSREEWFANSFNDRGAPRKLTEGELLLYQFRLGAGGRANAKANKESATGYFAPGKAAEAGRKGGRATKEKKVGIFTPGFDFTASGRKMFKLKLGVFAPEHLGKGGRVSGPITGKLLGERFGKIIGAMCAEKKIGVCGRSKQEMTANGKKGGAVAGRIAADSGRCSRMAASGGRASAAKGHLPSISGLGRHTRLHVSRGIYDATCKLCVFKPEMRDIVAEVKPLQHLPTNEIAKRLGLAWSAINRILNYLDQEALAA